MPAGVDMTFLWAFIAGNEGATAGDVKRIPESRNCSCWTDEMISDTRVDPKIVVGIPRPHQNEQEVKVAEIGHELIEVPLGFVGPSVHGLSFYAEELPRSRRLDPWSIARDTGKVIVLMTGKPSYLALYPMSFAETEYLISVVSPKRLH